MADPERVHDPEQAEAEARAGGTGRAAVQQAKADAGLAALPPRQRYLLQWAMRHEGRVLLYGDDPAFLAVALACGLDIHPGVARPDDEQARLPYPNGWFSVAISDHALAESPDMVLALRELRRVLDAGGDLLAVCVSHDALLERRTGAPLAHWLPQHPRLFRAWLGLLHRLHVGRDRVGRTAGEWAEHYLQELNRNCFYRSEEDLRRYFRQAGFRVRHAETDYLSRRWGLHPVIAPLAAIGFRRLVGAVLRAD